MIKLIKLICITIIICSGIAKAQERDPFLPYTWSAPTGAKAGGGDVSAESTNPLIDKMITSYTVIGVLVSPTDAMAIIKSRDRHEYFAYIGDPLGSEGGVIETINTEGITVDISGKIVPLKVSNRFDTQDGKQNDEK